MVKTRGDSNQKVRIEIPAFNVRPGEFVGIVGSNGSGKSTLLDMLGLLLYPDRVEWFFLNGPPMINLSHPSRRETLRTRRRHFAYVLQTGGLLEFLTIRENIRLAARLGRKQSGKIYEVAKLLGIEDVLDKRPGKISGGQRQKASIARALVCAPDIILADEPTSAMDTPSAARLMKTFRELTNEAGISLVMVTHDVERVSNIADTVYYFQISEMQEGILVSELRQGVPVS
jgi:putative ABC transport system ATP-binding protein